MIWIASAPSCHFHPFPMPAFSPLPPSVMGRLGPDGGPVHCAGQAGALLLVAVLADGEARARARAGVWLGERLGPMPREAPPMECVPLPGRGWDLRRVGPPLEWVFRATLVTDVVQEPGSGAVEWLDPDEARARTWDLLWPRGTGLARLGAVDDGVEGVVSVDVQCAGRCLEAGEMAAREWLDAAAGEAVAEFLGDGFSV